MDTFDEWVKTAQNPCIQEWGEKVVSLGASWDSFRRVDMTQITKDLVDGGIPILAARDIVDIATAEVQKSAAPMAIFWDLENMPIPSACSGRDMTSVLKNVLAPHGELIQFRGYASIGLNLIPEEKRSDLQLSGCDLVDCPHHGRKEVADKMIIVDAMHFAYQHPDAATLCFITGDVDYAYLLAVLQQSPQWRTIVISRGTMQSMLHVNCHMKIRWETDILQSIYSSRQEMDEETLESNNSIYSVDAEDQLDSPVPFAPLSATEFWKDDVELLKNVIIHEGRRSGTRTPRKSQVGNALRQTFPARFPNRDTIKRFLARAIEKGVVGETGDGAFKSLALGENSQPSMWLAVSASSPLPLDKIPAKAVDMAANKGQHFILFVRKLHCPSGYHPPKRAYIQSTEEWLLLLFPSHDVVLQSVMECWWLRKGTLVDWRKLVWANEKACSQCNAQCTEQELITYRVQGKSYCSPECVEWTRLDADTKSKAVECVVETLQFMANNDDIVVNQSLLAKIVALRHHQDCVSRKYARLWVKESIREKKAVEFKRLESKAKMICLYEHHGEALNEFPPENVSTHHQEQFVQDLLWKDGALGGVDRRLVAKELESAFEGMNTPFRRSRVLVNAQASGKLYVCKGPFLQIVGLTKEQAERALELEMASLVKEDPPHLLDDAMRPAPDPSAHDDSIGGIDKISRPDCDAIGDGADWVTGVSDCTNDEKDSTADEKRGSDSDGESHKSDISSSSSEIDLNAMLSKQNVSNPPASLEAFEKIKANGVATRSVSLETISSAAAAADNKQESAKVSKILPHKDENGNYATKNLHVTGFGDETSKQDVYQLFNQFGRVLEVVPKGSGSYAFMFVNTATKEAAISARTELYGRVLKGGRLKINFAK